MNIPYLLSVSYNIKLFKLYNGISVNWSGGIKTPKIADIKGTLKVFCFNGILFGKIKPFWIPTWGTVGERKGYIVPFAN